jgi:hypothetical protein
MHLYLFSHTGKVCSKGIKDVKDVEELKRVSYVWENGKLEPKTSETLPKRSFFIQCMIIFYWLCMLLVLLPFGGVLLKVNFF